MSLTNNVRGVGEQCNIKSVYYMAFNVLYFLNKNLFHTQRKKKNILIINTHNYLATENSGKHVIKMTI